MTLIDNQDGLDLLCDLLEQEKLMAVDTEFVRTKTFFPELCLIQVCIKTDCYAIDALSGLDFSKFKLFLSNPNICKIFHSGDQDVQTLEHCFHIRIQNIFDTQMAASWSKFVDSISYSELVKSVCGVSLSKEHQFSDWKFRPINDQKLQYALNDVKYLIPLYQYLHESLDKYNKLNWFIEDSNINIENNSHYLWIKYKKSSNKIDEFLLIKALLHHRYVYAKEQNIAPNMLIKNDNIPKLTLKGNLLKLPINDIEEYFENSNFLDYFINNFDLDKELDEQTYADFINSKSYHNKSRQANLVMELIEHFSRKYSIPNRFLANKDEIFAYICNIPIRLKFEQGFRYEMFGEFLLKQFR